MKKKIEEISTILLKKYDALFVSASYEERCLSITKQIVKEIDFTYKFVSEVMSMEEFIEKRLGYFTKENDFQLVQVDTRDQILTVDNILKCINEVLKNNSQASFLIDISTFTRQTLLILLRLLRNILDNNNIIQLLYTPAKEYSIGLPNENKWLSKGILEINSVYGYSGIIRPTRPYHLIVLMGYEVERASSIINEYEPTIISIGIAPEKESISKELHELNRKRFEALLNEFPNAESFEFSCIDAEICKNDLLKQVEKYPNCNTIITPMSNKISTVACALAAFENNEIQVVIAIPAVFNTENYSIPGDQCYKLDIENFYK